MVLVPRKWTSLVHSRNGPHPPVSPFRRAGPPPKSNFAVWAGALRSPLVLGRVSGGNGAVLRARPCKMAGAAGWLAKRRPAARAGRVWAPPSRPARSCCAAWIAGGHKRHLVRAARCRRCGSRRLASQNVNFAIHSRLAEIFLDAHYVDYSSTPSGKNLRAADIAERAKRFTIPIECRQ